MGTLQRAVLTLIPSHGADVSGISCGWFQPNLQSTSLGYVKLQLQEMHTHPYLHLATYYSAAEAALLFFFQ